MTKKMSIDLGNNTIVVIAMVNGELKTYNIESTYTTQIGTETQNVVEYNSVVLQLGARDRKAKEFAGVTKAEREYLEHQILWSCYKAFGPGIHHLELATGLPITEALDKRNKLAFMERLQKLNTICGKVEGNDITVTIIPEKIQLFLEGHGSLRAIYPYLSKDFSNLIIDIGMMTTDILIYEWIPGENRFSSLNPISLPLALSSILDPIKVDLERKGEQYSLSYLSRLIKEERYIVRTQNYGEVDLRLALKDRLSECINILKAIESAVGSKTTNYNKVMIGGGSEILLNILKDNGKQINYVTEIPATKKYSANAEGYYLNLI